VQRQGLALLLKGELRGARRQADRHARGAHERCVQVVPIAFRIAHCNMRSWGQIWLPSLPQLAPVFCVRLASVQRGEKRVPISFCSPVSCPDLRPVGRNKKALSFSRRH